jgi:hypothetical protein
LPTSSFVIHPCLSFIHEFVIPSEAEEPAVALSIIVGDRDSPGLKAFEAKLNPATIPNEFVIPSEAEEPAVVLSMIDR